MEKLTLQATTRTTGSKGERKQARRDGLVPAVVYGRGEEGKAIFVEPKALKVVLSTAYAFNNVFDLAIEGSEPVQCMVKAHQIDPVRRNITHVDFYRVTDEQMVMIDVPVEATGTAVGVKMGGRLQIVSRAVKLRCAVRDIPATVPHDVTKVQVSESVYIDEITPPEGCEFMYRNRYPVIRVARKRGAKVGAATEEAA
jgi:large subunit ribosomal protein L25